MLEPKPPEPEPKVPVPNPVPPDPEPNVPVRLISVLSARRGDERKLNIPVFEVLVPKAEPPPNVLEFVLLEPKENPVPPLPNDMLPGREARRAIFEGLMEELEGRSISG